MHVEKIPMQDLAQILEMQMDQGGEARLVVTGSSMLPMLKGHRDAVCLARLTEEARKGDVLLYRRENGKYILHRVVRKKGQTLICSGDNQYEKETVLPQQVIARVIRFTRKGKKYTAESRAYRLYVWFWVGIFPVRRPLIWLRHAIGRVLAAKRRRARQKGKPSV